MGKKAKKPAGAGSAMRPFYIAIVVVALGGLAALGYAVATNRPGNTATSPLELGTLDDRALYDMARPETLGSSDAPVRLFVFNDFECPFCAQFALQVKPTLNREFVDDGTLQIVYYDFPLTGHRHAFIAARAARCAGDQGRFWEYHDAILARQSSWSPKQNAMDDLVAYAGELGLDTDAFRGCLRSDRHAETVTANLRVGERLGVRGTPTVFINGRPVQRALDYNELTRAIRAEVEAPAAR